MRRLLAALAANCFYITAYNPSINFEIISTKTPLATPLNISDAKLEECFFKSVILSA